MDIDITALVSMLQGSFITWAVNYVFAATVALPYLSWIALPILSSLYRSALNTIFTWVSNNAILQAFFWNTAVRKSSEADDYVAAVQAKQGALDADYEKAEQLEMARFNDLVILNH